MKRVLLIGMLAVALLVVLAIPAFAAWDYQATGGAQVLNPSLVPYSYNLTARGSDDGAKGMVRVSTATLWWEGEVTAIQTLDNRAAMQGIITAASDESWIGLPFSSAVEDNGEGDGATEVDRIYAQKLVTVSLSTMLTESFFNNKGTLVEGNIQVH